MQTYQRSLPVYPNQAREMHGPDEEEFLNFCMDYDLLQKLAKQIPDDATIIKHLAKVQFKLGNKLAARATLDSATKYANVHEKKECESLLKRWKL